MLGTGVSKDIYFLSGQKYFLCADMDIGHKSGFPLNLYKISSDSLIMIQEIVNAKAYIDVIRHYAEYGKIIINYNIFGTDSAFVTIINTKDLEIKSINTSSDEYSCFQYWMIDVEGQLENLIEQDNLSMNSSERLIGFNLKTGKSTIYGDSVLNYFVGEGYQGLGVDDMDIICGSHSNFERVKVKVLKEDETLQYYIFPITEKIYYEFSMPKFNNLTNLDGVTIYPQKRDVGYFRFTINSSNYLIQPFRVKLLSGNKGKNEYLIYMKETKSWKHVWLNGSLPTLHAYGKWLVGCVVDYGIYGNDQQRALGHEIPGKKYRNQQERTEWGSSADYRFDKMKIFPYGILYLYDPICDIRIEWTALENGKPQGDSEILFVEDDIVYYRVNDKIYQREIINGLKVGKQKLLIQNERIPFVHWVFIN
jgi:hypothetical protein